MHRLEIWAIVIALVATGNIARAQTPGEIGHQGILTDSLGNPIVEGVFELMFSLHDQETGGAVLWSEEQTVTVEEGLFTVLLGAMNPIELSFDQPYWLSVHVDGDELDPRLRFSASPYSRRAASVDSVGPEALRPGSIPSDRLDVGDATTNSILAVMAADSAGWKLLGSENIASKAILISRLSPIGGGSGQVLTVQADSVVWANPPEITGAAIPDRSVRSTKMNSEDGEIGEIMIAVGGDSVVWSNVGTDLIADEAVTLAKLSAAGAGAGQILLARGDSVAWADPSSLGPGSIPESTVAGGGSDGQLLVTLDDVAQWAGPSVLPQGSIPASKLAHVGVTNGRVLLVADADSAGWGLISNSSIANRGISSAKLATTGGATGQILTINGEDAVWSNPAGIGKGTVLFNRLSPTGGVQGNVLQVVPGDTVGWSAITSANIAAGSLTPSRISVSGAVDGQVFQVDNGTAAWGTLDGTVIGDESIPIGKIDPGPAGAGTVLKYNGTGVVWAPDAMTLPFKASVTASDSVGMRVSSPSVLEGSGFAIEGIMTSPIGGAFASAIRGDNRSTSSLGVGVWGSHEGGGWGVYGRSTSGRGVYGSSPDGFAGYFSGNVRVTGSIEKAGGSFKIDHPLDPENRYLLHSFVESPDMMNVYNGNVTLDGSGQATVTLPEWFEALNTDYRYQLTAVGAPGPNLHIAQEIEGNSFGIAGGSAGMTVSWQVTGVRNDAWARQNRIPVEQAKEGVEQGTFLHPEAFGVSETRGVEATEQRP